MKIDETSFSHFVSSSLDGYCATRYRSFSKSSVSQKLPNISKKEVCFDLVKRLANGCLVSLELKVGDVYPNAIVLRSYNKNQNNALIALSEYNVNCNYCYNYENLSVYKYCSDEEVLSKCRTPSPINFSNPIKRPNDDQTLKKLVDNLSKKDPSGYDGLVRIFLDSEEGIPGVRRIFLFYNNENNEFINLSDDQVREVKGALEKHIGIKLEIPLSEKSSIDDYKKMLDRYAKDFANRLREIIDPPEPPSYTPSYRSPGGR